MLIVHDDDEKFRDDHISGAPSWCEVVAVLMTRGTGHWAGDHRAGDEVIDGLSPTGLFFVCEVVL